MTDLPQRSVSAPRAVRNAALWVLALFSGALALLGTWVILDRIPGMEAVLDDGTATTAQVYGAQSWSLVGAVVLGAGIVGLALALAVAARGAAARETAADPAAPAEPTAPDATAPGDDLPLASSSEAAADADADTDADVPTLAR